MPLGPLASPPAGMVERPIYVNVQGMAALEPDADGKYRDDGAYTVTDVVLGVPHVFVEEVDVTYLRGQLTKIREWTLVEPGGEDTAAVEFPQIYPFDIVGEVGSPELYDIAADRDVEIVIVEEGETPGVYDGTIHSVWCGIFVSDESTVTEDSATMEWHAKGLLIGQASSQHHNPANYLDPETDIGTVIPDLLNGLISRRFAEIAHVVTGIPVGAERGSESDNVWDRVLEILAKAWTEGGQQWTIRRTGTKDEDGKPIYEMVLKDNATIDYELEAGTRGVTAQLSRDSSQKYNVIWGRGVGPDGYAWRGMVYPDFLLGDFDESYLTGVYRRPLVWDPRVSDGRWQEDGLPQAEYDPDVEAEEVEINFPVGMTKAEAFESAQRQLSRDENPGMTGTIRLRTDPAVPETAVGPGNSRFLIPAGANLSYRNFRGGDFSTDFEPFLFRCSQVRVNLQSSEVELTVDSRQRDAMTLASIIERDRDAAVDPARRPGSVNRRSRQEPDVAFEYDGEAQTEIVEHEVPGGAWFVYPFPLSQVGRLVAVQIHCTVRFALALFGAPITSSELAALVPDPLASEDPFAEENAALTDAGLIDGWGRQGDAAGYSPGQESSGDAFTGDLLDTNTVEYVSALPPWVWVCEWCDGDGLISGRLYPAVND